MMFSKESIMMIPKTNYGNYEQYASKMARSSFFTYLMGTLNRVYELSGKVK
jgi:hypothetical protein